MVNIIIFRDKKYFRYFTYNALNYAMRLHIIINDINDNKALKNNVLLYF